MVIDSGNRVINGIATDYFRYQDITFKKQFSKIPTVVVTLENDYNYANHQVSIKNITTTGARIYVEYPSGDAKSGSVDNRTAYWIAVGE